MRAAKLLVFRHGTAIMHFDAEGVARKTRVRQVREHDSNVRDFGAYIPAEGGASAGRNRGGDRLPETPIDPSSSAGFAGFAELPEGLAELSKGRGSRR